MLSALARDWPRAKPLAAVVLLGDGRATTGGDPLPAARALVNRGGTAQVVVIGSATAPADAVVAALDAPAEAFTGEDLRLDVRLHVDEGLAKGWDLVLERNGRETAVAANEVNRKWRLCIGTQYGKSAHAGEPAARRVAGPCNTSISIG